MKRKEFIQRTALGTAGSILAPTILSAMPMRMDNFPFEEGQRIACIGDSVTSAGGNGYVERLQTYFDTNHADQSVTFLNLGLSGETVTGLTEKGHKGDRPYLFDRLDSLLSENEFEIATFCYGINCGIYQPFSEETMYKYEEGVQRFLDVMQEKGKKVILMTPPHFALSDQKKRLIESQNHSTYTWMVPYPEYDRDVIQEFRNYILQQKADHILYTVDTYQALKNEVEKAYGKDPIHPNAYGHNVIAKAFTDVVEA